MTTAIELVELVENEDGGATATLSFDAEGLNLLVKYGFVMMTLCGIHDVDLSNVTKAVELGSKQLKRDKEVAAELDDTQE